ncbi:unnamed protein product [Pleuronectes platessa]|uniref:Uncharacterized protein n=1 Tax=Pleuronectes platessa TaxID=8262 RepID=A0A9N7UVA6_PLEPL|nr:unnamed protein product [Pleuronectes platessa]
MAKCARDKPLACSPGHSALHHGHGRPGKPKWETLLAVSPSHLAYLGRQKQDHPHEFKRLRPHGKIQSKNTQNSHTFEVVSTFARPKVCCGMECPTKHRLMLCMNLRGPEPDLPPPFPREERDMFGAAEREQSCEKASRKEAGSSGLWQSASEFLSAIAARQQPGPSSYVFEAPHLASYPRASVQKHHHHHRRCCCSTFHLITYSAVQELLNLAILHILQILAGVTSLGERSWYQRTSPEPDFQGNLTDSRTLQLMTLDQEDRSQLGLKMIETHTQVGTTCGGPGSAEGVSCPYNPLVVTNICWWLAMEIWMEGGAEEKEMEDDEEDEEDDEVAAALV